MDRECDLRGKEVKCIPVRNPEGTRSLRKLRPKQEDVTKMDPKEIE